MTKQPFWIFGILIVILVSSCKNRNANFDDSKRISENWMQIFNNEDLSNWKVKIKGYPLDENFGKTFRVEEGLLKVEYEDYEKFDDRFGHLFYEVPFSSYKLKLTYRFTGVQVSGGQPWATKNSGVMIHCQSPESMGVDQDFPVSLEVQLLGGINQAQDRPTANLCTPGTHVQMSDTLIEEHCIDSSSKTVYDDSWVDLELEVYGDSLVIHKIDGIEVLRYSKPTYGGEYNVLKDKEGQAVTSGYIALQSESHPIEFKNIKILDLNPKD